MERKETGEPNNTAKKKNTRYSIEEDTSVINDPNAAEVLDKWARGEIDTFEYVNRRLRPANRELLAKHMGIQSNESQKLPSEEEKIDTEEVKDIETT
jgi:hypothetical protein